jgi:hypothetical protein
MQVSYTVMLTLDVSLLNFQTEAGCRVVIDALLLHTALNLTNTEYGVAIIPEFRIDEPESKKYIILKTALDGVNLKVRK